MESEKVVNWIKKYFEENGKGCKAVIGISGGADSSVCAALLVRALGVNTLLRPNITESEFILNLKGDKYECKRITGYDNNFYS